MVEWLKVKALSSNPSISKRKKKDKTRGAQSNFGQRTVLIH
jgi:hypothetical protein